MNCYSSSFSDGAYYASASSEFGAGEVAYAAFDYVFNDCCSDGWTARCYDYGPDSGQYNGYTNGIYSGSSTTTLANGTQLRGAWLQLQMPAAIVLQLTYSTRVASTWAGALDSFLYQGPTTGQRGASLTVRMASAAMFLEKGSRSLF